MNNQDYTDYVTRAEIIMNDALNELKEVREQILKQMNEEMGQLHIGLLESKEYHLFHVVQTLLDQTEESQKRVAKMHLSERNNEKGV